MNAIEDSGSETSETVLQQDSLDEIPVTTIPQVEDLTEEDKFLSDTSSLSSLILNDGPPKIKPRPYQLEMLEESLKRNIIVAVRASFLISRSLQDKANFDKMDTGSGKTHM